jgi:predicted AAA+ superfamily ATPase
MIEEMEHQGSLFLDNGLPPQLIADLRRLNPWWEGDPMPVQPEMRRHLAGQVRRSVDAGIAPFVVVRGPRQIGKTTAQFQMIQDLLDGSVDPKSILRVQFDDIDSLKLVKEPILQITDWFERFLAPERFNNMASKGQYAYLFFDEIQNLPSWDAQLKSLVDNATIKVVVTGSSALRIEMGRDSLAGGFNTLETGVLSLTEIGKIQGLDTPEAFLPDNGLGVLNTKDFWLGLKAHGLEHKVFRKEAFSLFSSRGGYPLAHELADLDWPMIADQLNETVIQRVIQHDLRTSDRGRKRDPQLLEELFRLCCRYAGQCPGISTLAEEVRLSLDANIGNQRVNHYLKFLGEPLLFRLIPPLEIRFKKKRGSPKLCLVDHCLRASWLQENIPLTPEALATQPELTTHAGHVAESIFGSGASTIHGLDIAHLPERGNDLEVDFVLTIGTQRIPIEIKYQKRIDPIRDILGLRSFLENSVNNAAFGLLVTQDNSADVDDPRIITMPLSTFMLLR